MGRVHHTPDIAGTIAAHARRVRTGDRSGSTPFLFGTTAPAQPAPPGGVGGTAGAGQNGMPGMFYFRTHGVAGTSIWVCQGVAANPLTGAPGTCVWTPLI